MGELYLDEVESQSSVALVADRNIGKHRLVGDVEMYDLYSLHVHMDGTILQHRIQKQLYSPVALFLDLDVRK